MVVAVHLEVDLAEVVLHLAVAVVPGQVAAVKVAVVHNWVAAVAPAQVAAAVLLAEP